jgi:myosin heavy subunit
MQERMCNGCLKGMLESNKFKQKYFDFEAKSVKTISGLKQEISEMEQKHRALGDQVKTHRSESKKLREQLMAAPREDVVEIREKFSSMQRAYNQSVSAHEGLKQELAAKANQYTVLSTELSLCRQQISRLEELKKQLQVQDAQRVEELTLASLEKDKTIENLRVEIEMKDRTIQEIKVNATTQAQINQTLIKDLEQTKLSLERKASEVRELNHQLLETSMTNQELLNSSMTNDTSMSKPARANPFSPSRVNNKGGEQSPFKFSGKLFSNGNNGKNVPISPISTPNKAAKNNENNAPPVTPGGSILNVLSAFQRPQPRQAQSQSSKKRLNFARSFLGR